MQESPRLVIIGGVAAGPKAAARARRLLPKAHIRNAVGARPLVS
ncbi:hypothetical protein [Candidatus Desulforudis audaxviator]|nr:hypothetical protein [Candidatus Desulforudis audaxviator]AZK59914.1 hypothetical protein Daudx_1367 [Candidatus Desulforudis audaxviator]